MKALVFLRDAIFVVGFSSLWCVSLNTNLHAQTEPFYKGKTMRIIVGNPPGGSYDRWARLLARYMNKYIPGNPQVIVQNMPGAGSLVASNYVYGVARPDGLTTLMPNPSLYLDQVLGREEVKFDVRKFIWLGTPSKRGEMLYMRADAPYKSIADIIKASEPPKCGAGGSGGTTLPRLLEEALGARFAIVTGYPGSGDIDMAVQKGEVICRAHEITSHLGREPYNTWHKSGFDRHLVQGTRKRDPRLADTPTIYEFMDERNTPDAIRRSAEFIFATDQLGVPMLVTPGTPAERVKILREAYTATVKDPELVAEAKRGMMDMDASSGEELQALMQQVMDQPPGVIDRVKKILGN